MQQLQVAQQRYADAIESLNHLTPSGTGLID
jgi:hypothetical protein